ncbi:MAG: DEAD/DEAH box helicase [Leptospiraceae bacterium]|nr:DEAD/DEAH box helicase [Leptospiraceae bacterium]
MLPEILALRVKEQVIRFLESTFEFKEVELQKEFLKFINNPYTGIIKGPWIDIKFPFKKSEKGSEGIFSYSGVFHPYIHQKKAWDRILKKQHSIITTGTGSGKTECFLYPVLEKALEKKQKGKKGISTVILYPMNALATDQEKRFAKVIYNTPELKNADIRVGTFIGRQEKKRGRRIMEENAAITDHETLLANPPDILLTNYKMLDFLLMRPSDSRLWKNNEEGTLEYLILDELHTYDGAQGTDVACLIRRLKDRLKCKQGSFCFVGTSATIDSGEKKNYSGCNIRYRRNIRNSRKEIS